MHKICLCPQSIAWIRKHLMKSARQTFTKMIKVGTISKIKIHHKKRRSAKQRAATRKLLAFNRRRRRR